MSENIAAAIAAKNEVIAQQGTSLDEVAAVLETKAAGGGTDLSLGLTSASVGQIIKVKSVDESGKPTAWEASDMPSGGGGTSEREWSMLADVDIAEIGGSTNIELTGLDNLTEFFIKWVSPKNESTQNSAYTLYINGTSLNQIVPIVKSSGNISFGYSYLRFNGLVWTIQKSAGAISEENTTLNYQNANCPYNLPLGIGTATNIKLIPPVSSYQAVSGNIIIYGR